MKKWLPLLLGALILTGINYAIWKNEQIIKNGETVLLELAPVDPRSLMQGDYMALAFAIERNIDKDTVKQQSKTGRLIIETDATGLASFIGFYEGQPLKQNQKTVRYVQRHRWNSAVSIQPSSFFFQEGQANHYQAAKYGVFKYQGPHTYLLTDLAGENKVVITPLKPTDKK